MLYLPNVITLPYRVHAFSFSRANSRAYVCYHAANSLSVLLLVSMRVPRTLSRYNIASHILYPHKNICSPIAHDLTGGKSSGREKSHSKAALAL